MSDHSAIDRRRALTRAFAILLSVFLLVTLLPAPQADASGRDRGHDRRDRCDRQTNNTYRKLLRCVTVEGVRKHQKAFQRIADRNDGVYPGTRAAGTEGYRDSAEYVADKMRRAGYDVTLNEFEFVFSFPSELRQTEPIQATYETGTFTASGDGTVEGPVIGVDLALEPPRESTSGCEPEDFDGADWSGPADIALIQRGTCFFAVKAFNAEAAGAEAVIIFNQGNTPEREGLIVATVANLPDGTPTELTIPVVGASFADGEALAQPGSTAFVDVPPNETRTDVNVIAELPGRNDDNVVMAGAHLDSVREGPGIQDNGSGSGAILEVGLKMRKVRPQNTLRFAWWGGEELGLLGSTAYVNGLSQDELDRIALYLNYDMIGSPNYVFQVYDADESSFLAEDFGATVPDGSIAIEKLFESFYTKRHQPYDDTAFSGRSDYQAFIDNDIPSGGLFTGAEVVKSEEQQKIWGGTAGEQFDQCYHLACDTFDNISRKALRINGDAVAAAMLTYAYSTKDVNGVRGRRVPGRRFRFPEPAGPQGTFVMADGGAGPGVSDQ